MRFVLMFVVLPCATLANAQNMSGPYVGGYVGGGSGDAHWETASGSKIDHSISGGLGGVQGGYNWQRGAWLLGAQADFGVGDLSGSSRCPNPTFECKTELQSLFTLRVRAGPIIANRVAIYGTAGVASGAVKTSVDNHANSKDDDTKAHGGWTAGAGVSGLITRHIQWQAEYLRISLRSENHELQLVDNKVKLNADIFRVGVHYKFF